MAIASLVLGIIALASTIIPGFGLIGIIVGIVGIILGALAKKNCPNSMATAGLVCSIIGTAICGIAYIACLACYSATYDTLLSLQ